MAMKLDVGDIVQTKKKHPCGENRWELLRVGIDFKMQLHGMRQNGRNSACKT